MLIKGKGSVLSYFKGFHHTEEWSGKFANRKAVNRDTLYPGWQSAEKDLSFLPIKLRLFFIILFIYLMTTRLNIPDRFQRRHALRR